jgi:hypothetical protein
MKKLIIFEIWLTLFFFNVKVSAQSRFPPYYNPEGNIRNIKAFPAPLLAVNGSYGIWFKTSFKQPVDQNKITHPIIICEGFDVANNFGFEDLYDQLNNNAEININRVVTNAGFLDDLRCAGFDIIILNLGSNTKVIQENAELFIKLIKEIDNEVKTNARNFGTFYHRAVVGGISMGGLISRLALTDVSIYKKEFSTQEDIPVEAYLSFDSPHSGANIPLGLQHLGSFIPGVSALSTVTQVNAVMPPAFKQLNVYFQLEQKITSAVGLPYIISPAAQQMAITYGVAPPFATFPYQTTNLARALFDLKLNSAGMPLCRKIGVSCGASMRNQQGINPRQPIIEISGGGLCLIDKQITLPFGLGGFRLKYCPLTFGMGAWAMPGKKGLIFDKTAEFGIGAQAGVNGYSIVSTYPLKKYEVSRDFLSAPRDVKVDHVPGAHLPSITSGLDAVCEFVNEKIDIPLKIDFTIEGRTFGRTRLLCWQFWQSGCWGYFGNINVSEDLGVWRRPLGNCVNVDNFTFVPTASALAIKNKNWHTDFDAIGPYPQNDNDTEFDAIYWDRQRNNAHAYVAGDAMATFMENEIAPINLYLQNRTFKNGYTNTFMSDGFIALGKNVDQTPNRQAQGDLRIENAGQIKLVIPDNQFVYFDDGFDASNLTSGELEVITYPASRACLATARGTSVTNDPSRTTWRALRKSNESEDGNSKTTKNDFSGLIASGEGMFYTFAGQKYSEEEFIKLSSPASQLSDQVGQIDNTTIATHPNPIVNYGNAIINLHLQQAETISIEIKNEAGQLLLRPLSNMHFEAGDLEFDFNSLNLINGVYYVYAKSQDKVIAVNKILILRD